MWKIGKKLWKISNK